MTEVTRQVGFYIPITNAASDLSTTLVALGGLQPELMQGLKKKIQVYISLREGSCL